MSSPTIAIPQDSHPEVRSGFGTHDAETPGVRSSAIRGAVTGMVLGAGVWALLITALVKLFKG